MISDVHHVMQNAQHNGFVVFPINPFTNGVIAKLTVNVIKQDIDIICSNSLIFFFYQTDRVGNA